MARPANWDPRSPLISTPPASFVFSDGSYSSLQPGTPYVYVTAINNAGQILGHDSRRSYLISGDTSTVLNVPGVALGINDLGQIVGLYQDHDNIVGFLLSDGVYTLLQVPGSILTEALGINNSGQIVGFYDAPDGTVRGFLATPVPEPTTLGLLALRGLALLVSVGLRPVFFVTHISSRLPPRSSAIGPG